MSSSRSCVPPTGARAISARRTVSRSSSGWTTEQVAEVLQIDPNTVCSHFKRYRQDGLKETLNNSPT
jgi:hypothetical protein